MTVNGVRITEETILKTREHFADIHRACIENATSGKTRVNDLARYLVWQESMIDDSLSGRSDHTLTFVQRALWIQTGECPAILG